MIRLFKPLWIVTLVVVGFACSEDDPLPRSTVDFSTGIPEVGIPVKFDNLSLNADRYEWRFGDGQSSDQISPLITFNEPGPVEVVLKAFTKDGQVDSLVRNITIRQRVLIGYSVNIYPTKNGDSAWDPDETGDNVFPDILIQLLVDKDNPTDAELDNALFDGIFNNVSSSNFSRGEGSTGFQEDIILTDEDWGFALFDFDDGNPDITTDDDFEFMAGVLFNPVQSLTAKTSDGTAGVVSIIFSDDTFTLDFDLIFELR